MAKPYVFVNVAVSLDGRITDWTRKQVRISCEEDMERVDRLRAESDAITVGIGTVLADNPSLKVKSAELREWRVKEGKAENPLRVVIDSRARTPLNFKVVDGTAKTLIAVAKVADESRIRKLREKGIEVVVFGERRVDVKQLVAYLYEVGVRKLMVEGGAGIIGSFLKAKLVNRLMIYHGGVVFGEGLSLVENRFDPHLHFKLLKVERVGKGFVSEWEPVY